MLPPHPPNGIIPPTPHNKIQVPLKQYTIHCIFEEKNDVITLISLYQTFDQNIQNLKDKFHFMSCNKWQC